MIFFKLRLKPVLALALCLSLYHTSLSQHKHVLKKLAPGKDEHLIEYIKETNSLGEILVSGYLDGKLNGYSSSIVDSVTQWRIATDFPAWEKQTSYYQGDLVTFSGKVYRSLLDENPDSPDNVKSWKEDEVKEPLSHLWHFPGQKDILPKGEFLNRMVAEWPAHYPPWSRGESYYENDRVSFNGRNYEARLNDVRNDPETDHQMWQEIYGGAYFHNWRSFSNISVLLSYSVHQSDTVWIPEMLSIRTFDNNVQIFKSICSFYYDDVMKYLQTVSQPVTTVFKYGHLDNTLFEFNSIAKAECLAWLKSKIKNKALKLSEKNIMNPKLYQNWLADTTSSWGVYQQPSTRDLKLYRADTEEALSCFLLIPSKTIETLYKKEKIARQVIQNYTHLLSDANNFAFDSTYRIDDRYDSIAPLPPATFTSRDAKDYVFIEEYKLRFNAQSNAEITALIPQVWSELERAYFSGEIKTVNKDAYSSFFNDNYDWSNVTLSDGEKFDQTFTLSSYARQEGEYLYLATQFPAIGVVYQKEFGKDKPLAENYIKPLVFSIFYKTQNDIDNYTVDGDGRIASFNWTDVKRVLQKQPGKFAAVVDAIEKGNLDFSSSQLMYGLKEK